MDNIARGRLSGGVRVESRVRCWECHREVEDPYLDACPSCDGLLEVSLDLEPVKEMAPSDLRTGPLGVWRYTPFLPVRPSMAVSLQEGGTPLYGCAPLASDLGVKALSVKYEGANPTGSFKDRGMTVGITRAKEIGADMVGCASTGNTSASLAAYAAKAGIGCLVLLPEGKVALGKLAQAIFYGAKVVSVEGNFDDALRTIREMAAQRLLYLLNSINPFRPEGQKTLLLEIMDQLDYRMPDRIVLPVGNAGNISAVHKALKELEEVGWIDSMPMLTGVQASGSRPLVESFRAGRRDFDPEPGPETVATAIRIGNPVSGRKALDAIYSTGGTAVAVSDEEILDAQLMLGRREGIGVEPASAASVAGLRRLLDEGVADRDEEVVCICTGNALKDPDTMMSQCVRPYSSRPEVAAVLEAIR